MRLYIAILDEFPDHMACTLVAHTMLSAHLAFQHDPVYIDWITNSYKKCTVRVNQKEFDKIAALDHRVYLGYEMHTLEGRMACAIVMPHADELRPNVLKFAKMWKPKHEPT